MKTNHQPLVQKILPTILGKWSYVIRALSNSYMLAYFDTRIFEKHSLRPNWCGFSFDRKIGASYTSGRAQEGSVQVPIWRHAGASETVRFLVWFRAKASSCSGSDWEAPTLRKSWCGSGLDPCQPGKQCGKVLGPLRSKSITRLFGIGFGGSPFPRISLNCQSCKALNSKPFFKQ